MKKLFIYGALAAVGVSLTGCNDFLNDNREPLSQQVVNAAFWNNTMNVENQLNYFYQAYLGYGNATGYGAYYFNTATDDQAGTVGGEFRDWRVQTVPASSSDWNTPYQYIRRANQVIVNLSEEGNSIETGARNNYLGIARLNRAYQYYKLVRCYGDVPLVKKVLDVTDDAELFGPRTARNEVMDFVLEDLNFAVTNISTKKSPDYFSSDMARAVKAEICLFEASYARYVAKDEARAKKYFEEVVSATTPLLAAYPISDDYRALYTSLNGALLSNPEIIFCKAYQQGVFMHSTVDYTSGSTPIAGITKDAFDSFLFLDGKPYASTTVADKDAIAVYVDPTKDYNKGQMDITAMLACRDQRLELTTYSNVFFEGFEFKTENTAPMTSTTGYGVRKYNNYSISQSDATSANKNYTDAPLYWGAYVALAYAEAKAELGTLTDGDLNQTLNKLYARAGLPAQTVASLSAMNDPANNMGVSSLLWEVRRCRRCELLLDNDIRYWDLIRWNKLELMDTKAHPNIVRGADITNVPADYKVAVVNNCINPVAFLFGGKERVYNTKYNLFPLPTDQLQLNSKLTQNPGW